MGKKSSPKAPVAPDYVGAAKAQGEANIDAAKIGAELARTNQYTPYGSQVFTQNPGSNQWSSTQTLSPDQQKLYDLQTQGQQTLGETGVAGLNRVQQSMGTPFDLSGLPSRVNSVTPSSYGMYTGPNEMSVTSLDTSGLSKLPNLEDFAPQRQEVQDALYGRATSTLDPQFQKELDQTRTRLINSGVQEGSEPYNNAMDAYQRSKTNAYGDARDRSILAGGQEQERMFRDTLASQGQQYGQILSGGQFQNQAQQQGIDNTIRSLGFNNQQELQGFMDRIAAGNYQNQQRGAGIDEQAYLRNLPLSEYNSLMTGAQPTMPNFAATQGVQGPAAAPTFAGAQAQGQYGMDLYNAQIAQQGSAMGGLYGALGSAAQGYLSKFSDRRLKSDIKKIGQLDGTYLPVYSYMIFGKPQIGVMADEVRMVHPEAVLRHPSGYDMVDYSKIPGWHA